MEAPSSAKKAIMSLSRANCAQMFFIYSGRANKVMNFLDLVRNTGLSSRNLALIRDFYASNYTRGISPDIPSFEALLKWHRDHLEKHPQVTEIHNIGNSSGGYGAILFGSLLGVKKVFAFAPRTAQLSTADAAKAYLKQVIATGNGGTEYFLHFSPGNGRDMAFARYFEDSPGVVLCPYHQSVPENSGHFLMKHLVDTGELRGLLPPYVAAAPTQPGVKD
jgi:hypothetical protein